MNTRQQKRVFRKQFFDMSRRLSLADRVLAKILRGFAELSEDAYLKVDGMSTEYRSVVQKDGTITWGKQRYHLVTPVNPLDDGALDRILNTINDLYDTGLPYRLYWYMGKSRSRLSTQIRSFEDRRAKNQVRFDESFPAAAQPYEWFAERYLQTMREQASDEKTMTPYLLIPAESVPNLSGNLLRRLNAVEVRRFLSELNGLDWQEFDTEEIWRKWGEITAEEQTAPDRVTFNGTHVVSRHGDNKRLTSSIEIEGVTADELRQMFLGLVDEQHEFWVTQTIWPVSERKRDRFVRYATRWLKHWEVSQIAENGGELSEADQFALQRMQEAISQIQKEARLPHIHRMAVHIVSKDGDSEGHQACVQSVERSLRNSKTRNRRPKDWLEQQELHSLSLTHLLQEDEMRPPVSDSQIAANLRSDELRPTQGIYVGYLVDEGGPILLPLGLYGVTGGMSSGKSVLLKVLVANLLTEQPGQYVWVLDNAMYPDHVSRDERLAQMKGWIDLCQLFGGEIVFSGDFKTPEEFAQELRRVEGSHFVLYYPHREHVKNDRMYLTWLVQQVKNRHDPRRSTEGSLENAVVFDDLLGWFKDPSDERSGMLSSELIDKTIANGTACFITVQTPRAIETTDPRMLAILQALVSTWFNFSTSAFGDIPRAIGVTGITQEGLALQGQIVGQQQSLTVPNLGIPVQKGRCGLVVNNRLAEVGQIDPGDELLRIISRNV